MKKQFLLPLIFLLLLTSLFLSGYTTKNVTTYRPNDEVIREDLEQTLQEYYPDTVSSFDIELTEENSEEDSYEVTFEIDADGLYADFQIKGSISYQKDSDKWHMTDCRLEKTDYEVVRYPNPEELFNQVMEGNEKADKYTLNEAVNSENTVTIDYLRKRNKKYYTYQTDYYETFIFEPEEETWLWDTDSSYSEIINLELKDIAGTYISKKENSDTIYPYVRNMTISEVSDNSFIISGGEFSDGMMFSFYIDEGGGTGFRYEGENDNMLEFSVVEYTDTNKEFQMTGTAAGETTDYLLYDDQCNTIQREGRERLNTGILFDTECINDELYWIVDPEATAEDLIVFFEATGIQPYLYYKAYDPSLSTEEERMEFLNNYYVENYMGTCSFFVLFIAEDPYASSVDMYWIDGFGAPYLIDDELGGTFMPYVYQYWNSDMTMDDIVRTVFNLFATDIMYDFGGED